MQYHTINSNLKLVPYYPNHDVTIKWYQDPSVYKQVDNIDYPYTREMLEAMYDYLNANGECYYIEWNGVLVGDVTLYHGNELAIVIAKDYQNKHIGRQCINYMIQLARKKGLDELKVNIYSFNHQSQKMFEALGFQQMANEWYVYKL